MNHTVAIPLSDHGFLRIEGADAVSFLQGQLSSDLRQLRAARAQISSYNSPKGRMLAVVHLIADGEAILIELHRSILDATLKRLRMFVLRSKLTITDVSADVGALGLIGQPAAQALASAGLPVPGAPLDCRRDDARDLIVVRRLGDTPRYSVIGPRATIAALAASLGETATFDAWRRADIEAGVPVVYPQTADHFVPQMANLDLLDGIGFDKGCYTGQEIVARLHYLGQLKRRMFVCRIDGAAPAPGDDVVSGEPAAAAGEIVDAIPADGAAIAGVVLQLSHRDSADLRLADGRALRILRGPAG